MSNMYNPEYYQKHKSSYMKSTFKWRKENRQWYNKTARDAAKRRRDANRVIYKKKCLVCGKEFETSINHTKLCGSMECRKKKNIELNATWQKGIGREKHNKHAFKYWNKNREKINREKRLKKG